MHLEAFSIVPLLDEEIFQTAFEHLPSDGLWIRRKEKILRQKEAEDRCLTLAAGLLARRAFLKMKVSFSALSLEQGGKPVITDEKHFFNLSHSGMYAVCAYGLSPSGVDIQKETPDRFHIAERCFTEGEQALIREQGPEMFTRIWARKESYLKFTGQGIRVPLNSFEVLPGEQTLPVFFQEFTLEGYRIALCSEEEMAVSLKFLTLEELLF